MSAPLPRPSASSRAGTTGRTAARGKIAAATQRQKEGEKLLAVFARSSREPAIDKAHAHDRAAPATPSSVDRASRLSHRSAEKLKQPVIASISSVLLLLTFPSFRQFPSIMAQTKVRVTEKNYLIWKYWLSLRRRQLLPQLNKRRLRIHVFVYRPCSTKRRRWLSQRRRSTILIMFAQPANCVNL